MATATCPTRTCARVAEPRPRQRRAVDANDRQVGVGVSPDERRPGLAAVGQRDAHRAPPRSTTWLLVSTKPSGVKMTPDPPPRPATRCARRPGQPSRQRESPPASRRRAVRRRSAPVGSGIHDVDSRNRVQAGASPESVRRLTSRYVRPVRRSTPQFIRDGKMSVSMGERVTFKANGRTAPGYLARPKGTGPGVVVIQEWWGWSLTSRTWPIALRRKASSRWRPDLYHGEKATSPDQAGKLMMSLRDRRSREGPRRRHRSSAAAKGVTGSKVGTVGFCMGGALSLFAASQNPEGRRVCGVLWRAPQREARHSHKLQAPVLGIWAGKAGFGTPAVVTELDKQLSAAGKRHNSTPIPPRSRFLQRHVARGARASGLRRRRATTPASSSRELTA